MPDDGAERTAVKTYVPVAQKSVWADDADAMDMSLSEFVRSMVQAGRRNFELDSETSDSSNTEEPDPADATPGGEALESVLLDALEESPHEFDQLVDVVTADLRASLGEEVRDTLQSLQAENVVTHDPLEGGYRVVDDE